ncbi:MAG: hypothetical protein R3B47_20105 [Bacteroidia bacterium]
MSINDNAALAALEQRLVEVAEEPAIAWPRISLAVKPLRSNVSLEEIDMEQNYSPVSYEQFRADADKLGIKEPIDELLSLLTK